MRILVMDDGGLSLDWSLLCQKAGHKVKWYCPGERGENIGKGMIEHVKDPFEWYKWADLIFYTSVTKWLDAAESWKKQGWPVICGSKESILWETERGTGQKVLQKAGIEIIPTKEFFNYDMAIEYVKKTMGRYVSKPNDGDADRALSYCAKTPEDMIFMLERWKKNNKLKSSFVLQEFVPGIEVAVSGWWGPGGFNQGWEENFEFKKLMNDDKGVATGEQGTVMHFVKKSRLAELVLKPLEEALEEAQFIGNIDVNCIVNEKGVPLPIEFTMRPGWPAFNIQQALHKGDPAEWLMELWEGKDAKNWELNKVATGVVLSIPDYPYNKKPWLETDGIPIYGDLTRPSIHLCECRMGDAPHNEGGKIITKPTTVTAGTYVLVTTGIGATVSESQKAAYKELETLSLPNSPMWRTDIGNRLKKQLPELQKHGLLTEMTF